MKVYNTTASGNMASHLKDQHSGCLDNDKYFRFKELIENYIVSKKFKLVKALQTEVKKRKRKVNMSLDQFVMDFTPLRYRLAYWLIRHGRPLYLVNDTGFRQLLQFLHLQCPLLDRMTIYRAMRVVHGFIFEKILHRLKLSARRFNGKSFFCYSRRYLDKSSK